MIKDSKYELISQTDTKVVLKFNDKEFNQDGDNLDYWLMYYLKDHIDINKRFTVRFIDEQERQQIYLKEISYIMFYGYYSGSCCLIDPVTIEVDITIKTIDEAV